MAISKSVLIEHLYEHMDEGDWLDGLELYQAAYVSKLKNTEGLISASVASTERQQAEVRIKIHPAGNTIQWIECTCRKNRAHGIYCEHIGAAMLHIDREAPQVFAKLDPKMPLKPPSTIRKKRPSNVVSSHPNATKQDTPTQSLIKHLEGSIQNASLVGNGPEIKIRMEIKPGQLTSYTIPLDEAAKFLKEHVGAPYLTPDLQKLRVYDQRVHLGTRILANSNDGSLDLDRVCVIEHEPDIKTKKSKKEKQSHKNISNELFSDNTSIHVCDFGSSVARPISAQFASFKAMKRHFGKSHIYLPDLGYFPFESGDVTPLWFDAPYSQVITDDAAANMCNSQFADLKKMSRIYIDSDIAEQSTTVTTRLDHVNILGMDGSLLKLLPILKSGETEISMVDVILDYRNRKRQFYRNGKKWIRIPDFVTQYGWKIDDDSKAIQLDALSLMRFKATVGELDKFAGSKKILQKLRDQSEFQKESIPPTLESSHLSLREYQTEGYSWMWWLYQNGLSGLLADEMGLGKTHQAMALLTAARHKNPKAKFLVICPTTVLDHWLDKINDFSPGLNPIKYHGPKRHQLLPEIIPHPVTVLSSFGVILRDSAQLAQIDWEIIVIDEAHFVKNTDTATYRAICGLQSKSRFCLSGTPMENNLLELKAVFDFLVPGYLGSDEYFRRNWYHTNPEEQNSARTSSLQRLIHPFKMRRTKNLVLKDLPEKVEDIRHCTMSDEQLSMYRQTIELKARPLLDEVKDSSKPVPFLHVFAVLTLLKQICDHPSVILGRDTWKDHQSGKFELFKELISEALESGHKVVVYSQYIEMLHIISTYLTSESITHEVLTGSTTNRGRIIERFQSDENCKVFCASLLAGGVGIDLTAANVVIHYDRWWNASKENQATDRVHRIGQNKNVQVLKLVTRDSLEERIDSLIRRKQALFEKFLDQDEEIFKSFTRDEIIELLG